MPTHSNADAWIAAEYVQNYLTLWCMQGNQDKEKVTCEVQGKVTADIVADIAAKTDWDLAPVFACGLSDAQSQSVPTSCLALPILESCHNRRVVVTVSEIEQANPFGCLGAAANQISGFQSLNPDWDGVVCIVQNRSFWALLSANEVVSFDSTLTPQLAQQLGFDECLDKGTMCSALQDGLSRPEALASRLSSALALAGSDESMVSQATSEGWGYLLGAELASTRPYWLGQNLALVAEPKLAAIYNAAFESQFLPVTVANAEKMTLAGLVALRRRYLAEVDTSL